MASPDTGGIRAATQRRILQDLDVLPEQWKMLVLDKPTSRILQSATKRLPPQVLEEFLPRKRPPYDQDAIYYVAPTRDNAALIAQDFGAGGSNVLYRKAHILFSSRVLQPSELQQELGRATVLRERLGVLREFNLEYLVVDNRTISTFQEDAFSNLFSQRMQEPEWQLMVSRLSTVFATLTCKPNIRYQAGSPGTTICRKVATGIQQALADMQQKGVKPPLPSEEDCDLLVLDRSFDVAAPFLHPWSYEAMTYEYINIEDDRVVTSDSNMTPDELLLDEDDNWWVTLRHLHYIDSGEALSILNKQYQEKFKAWQKGDKEDQAKDIARLPDYKMQTAKSNLHRSSIFISVLKPIVQGNSPYEGIKQLMQWQLDMLTGKVDEKGMQARQQELEPLRKLNSSRRQRLLICWLSAYPKHMTQPIKKQWQALLNLSAEEVDTACNIARLGVGLGPPSKLGELYSSTNDFSDGMGKPGQTKTSPAVRYKPGAKQHQMEVALQGILRDLHLGSLSTEKFPYLVGPPVTKRDSNPTGGSNFNFGVKKASKQMQARRLIVFVIGGVCREEMRVVHQLSASLKRDIILVSTAVGTAGYFLEQLKTLPSI